MDRSPSWTLALLLLLLAPSPLAADPGRQPAFANGLAAELVEWTDIVPLGIPARAEHPATQRVALMLPGGAGRLVFVAVEPLTAYGEPIRDPGWPGVLASLPALRLVRQSDDLSSPDFNLFVSEEIVFTADPRLTDPARPTVAAGDRIRVRLLGPAEYGGPDAPDLSWLRPEELAAAVSEARSWRMDLVPGDHPAPSSGASLGTGDVLAVLLHSGELLWSETDLAFPGRAIGFAWQRSLRSQALYNGPLGRGWDSPYLARVRELPDGDVEYRDGTGALWTFRRRAEPRANLEYEAPAGLELALVLLEDHFALVDPDGTLHSFNVEGDLARIEDRNGNRIELLRDASGRLRNVRDDLGRYVRIDYDTRGRIAGLADSTGRTVIYTYDDDGRDELVERRFAGFSVGYGYESIAAGDDAPRSLASVRDETGTEWLKLGYLDARVVTEQWGKPEEVVRIAYEPAATRVTDRRGNVTRYVHDPAGRILSVIDEDPEGEEVVTSYTWLATGQLERVVLPEGNAVEHEYEDERAPLADPRRSGNVTLVRRLPRPGSEELPEEVRLAYDPGPMRRAVRSTDERGHETRLSYDGSGNLTEVLAPREALTKFEYNRFGQLTRETGPEGLATEYAYWPETMPGGSVATLPPVRLDAATGGYLRSVTVDPGELKLRTEHLYDALGRVVETVNPAGGKTLFEYDPRGLVTRETRKNGEVAYEVNQSYDGRGLPDLTTYLHTGAGGVVTIDEDHEDPLGFLTKQTVTGPGLEQPVVTSWTPDANRNVAMVTHPLGWTESLVYDALDREVQVTRTSGTESVTVKQGYDRNGFVRWRSSPRNEQWKTVYEPDGHDRLKTTTSPLRRDVNPETDEPIAEDLTVEREYWPGGRLEREVTSGPRPEGAPEEEPRPVLHERSLVHDDLGFLTSSTEGPDPLGVTIYEPDRLGRNRKVRDRRSKPWEYEYYANGWLRSAIDPLGNLTSKTYHPLGGVATVTSDGMTSTWRYDLLGRPVEQEDAAGHRSYFVHDSRDNVLSVVDALGQATTRRYDALDRTLSETGPEGERVLSTFDAEGNLLTHGDALGNATTYARDGLGRLESVTYPGPTVTSYTYNAADQVATETTPRSFVSTLSYDAGGRLVGREVKDPEQETVESEVYGHDALGRLVLAENGTAKVSRSVDSFANIKAETVEVKGLVTRTLGRTFETGLLLATLTYPGGRAFATTYDDAARADRLTSAAETFLDYDWEGPSRLKTKSVRGELVSSYGYETSERQLSSLTRTLGGRPVLDWGVEWTGRHEVDKETDRLRRASIHDFDYDKAGRLCDAAYPERALRYRLDAVRNVTERVEKAGGEYARCELGKVAAGNRYESYAGSILSYDADGNLASSGQGDSYVHDWKGRLVEARTGAGTVRYGYDALGRKVKREVEGGAGELFWYDGWDLVEATDLAGAKTYEVVNGRSVDEPVVFWDAQGTERRLFQDRVGNVAGVADLQGRVLEAWRYDAYGRPRRHGAERVDHVRLQDETFLVNGEPVVKRVLVARFTGEVQLETAALELVPFVDGAWELSGDGRELRFVPRDAWPVADMELTVRKELHSVFGIELAEGRSVTWDSGEAGEGVLADWVALAVERVTQATNGEIEVLFSETVDPESLAGAFRLLEVGAGEKPFTASVSPSDERIVVVDSSEPFTPGEEYALELVAGVAKDRSGTPVGAGSFPWTAEEFALLVWDRGDTGAAEFSETGNRLGFMGRPIDPITGLWDFRRRELSSRLGRWVQPDPTGHSDGNLYAAFKADPVNHTDPMGTLAVEVTPEGAETKSDAYEWALLESLGYSDTFKYGVIQEYSQHWPTVRGRAELLLSGYMAEAGLRQAGKVWLVGAGAAATGGLAATGLTAAGVTTTTWGGTLLLGTVSGAVAGLGAQGTSDLIEGQLNSPSTYLWSVGTGAALGGAFSAAARGLSAPGGAPLDLSSVEWGPQAIVIYGRLPVLNAHFEPTPAMATEVLAARTAAENARLAANPTLAQSVLSRGEYLAGQTRARIGPMAYGNALERLTAIRIRNSPLDSQILVHVGGPRNPDFIGFGPVAGSNFDITTPGQVRAHLRRPGYGPGLIVVPYQRPQGFRVFP